MAEQVGPAYPKWRYKDGESRLVETAAEEKALGAGWRDNPGPAKSVAPAPVKPAESVKPVEAEHKVEKE